MLRAHWATSHTSDDSPNAIQNHNAQHKPTPNNPVGYIHLKKNMTKELRPCMTSALHPRGLRWELEKADGKMFAYMYIYICIISLSV